MSDVEKNGGKVFLGCREKKWLIVLATITTITVCHAHADRRHADVRHYTLRLRLRWPLRGHGRPRAAQGSES
jgi:hypothetical protein